MSIARKLAEFVVEHPSEDIPDKALDYAQMLIASTVASAALGSTLDSSKIIRQLEVERGGVAEATAWFGPENRLPVAAVARLNAVASDAAASDDSDLRNIIHQGTTACSAALSVAEMCGASGKDTLDAIVMGYEAVGGVSAALGLGFKHKGFHGCFIAGFASVAAACRLMGLSTEQTMHAISLTGTSIGGIMAAANTSIAREYHAGMAAMQGINAALAAAKGYTSEPKIFETKAGFVEVYGDRSSKAETITNDLGKRWSILEDLGIKLVPGGHPFHAIAEAAAEAAIAGNITPEIVDAIEVYRPGFQYPVPEDPNDLIAVAHSPVYYAAAGVADRGFTWSHAFPEKISSPSIRALLPKVKLMGPPADQLELYKSGAMVCIRSKDGRSYSSIVFSPKGSAVRGIEWPDIEEKYRTLVPYADLSPGQIDISYELIRNFRGVSKAAALAKSLH